MEIETQKADGIGILICQGQLLSNEGTKELRRAVHDLVKIGTTRILLDVTNVSNVDNIGLGEIVHAYTAVNRTGGFFVLLGPSLRLRNLVNRTQLNTVFTVFERDQHVAALAHLKGGSSP